METEVTSSRLPGKNLISATLDRRVMGLADRGGASRFVGDRWADLCADMAEGWVGWEQRIPYTDDQFSIEHVARLDAVPEVAATAARNGLQNPDILLRGQGPAGLTIQALDAKFSVETAKARQVSQEMLQGLMTISEVLEPLVGPMPDDVDLVDGMFLCPDYPLTHLMFRQRKGIVKATVRPEQVMVLPVASSEFFGPLDPSDLMSALEDVDQLRVRSDSSMLAGLYYFRLSRGAVGIWTDRSKPLLSHNDTIEPDLDEVRHELTQRGASSDSAWSLLLEWDRDVDVIRNQRAAVEQVAGLPVSGRMLREQIELHASVEERVPPSVNKVRRRVGAWYRGQLRELVGPIMPPVADIGSVLNQIARAGASLRPALEKEIELAIEEAVRAADPISESEPETAAP